MTLMALFSSFFIFWFLSRISIIFFSASASCLSSSFDLMVVYCFVCSFLVCSCLTLVSLALMELLSCSSSLRRLTLMDVYIVFYFSRARLIDLTFWASSRIFFSFAESPPILSSCSISCSSFSSFHLILFWILSTKFYCFAGVSTLNKGYDETTASSSEESLSGPLSLCCFRLLLTRTSNRFISLWPNLRSARTLVQPILSIRILLFNSSLLVH